MENFPHGKFNSGHFIRSKFLALDRYLSKYSEETKKSAARRFYFASNRKSLPTIVLKPQASYYSGDNVSVDKFSTFLGNILKFRPTPRLAVKCHVRGHVAKNLSLHSVLQFNLFEQLNGTRAGLLWLFTLFSWNRLHTDVFNQFTMVKDCSAISAISWVKKRFRRGRVNSCKFLANFQFLTWIW